jgi:hypothetical protein
MAHREGKVQVSKRIIEVATADFTRSIASGTALQDHRSDQWVNAILAVVLFLAASLKAYQLNADPGSLVFGVIHSQYVVIALIQTEVLLASWLLLNNSSRPRLIIAMLCFTVFAFAAVYEAYRSLASCGCFGILKVSPKITAGFDVIAVVLLWITRPRHNRFVGIRVQRIRLLAALTAALLASGISWTMFFLRVEPAIAKNLSSATDDLVVLEPELWVDKPFGLFDEIDGSAPLRHGRWLVVFYHYDCDSCLEAIPKYRSLVADATKESPHLAFVAMPPTAPAGQDPVTPSSASLRLNLRPDHDWFATTPVVVVLEDGRVLSAYDGEDAVDPPTISQWR